MIIWNELILKVNDFEARICYNDHRIVKISQKQRGSNDPSKEGEESNMNMEYLKYFSVLAKVQHYGRAAQILNISQPGLSHAMKSLEEEFGVVLFQKEGRNVGLSIYGREVLQEVDRILENVANMEQKLHDFRMQQKSVRIASVYPFATSGVPQLLREYKEPFPFVVYNRMTPEIAQGLEEGKYDIGFCTELLHSDELEYYPIRDSYIAVVVPKDHELAGRKEVSLEEVAKYPQVLFSKTSGIRRLQEQVFESVGVKINAPYYAEETGVIVGMIENGFGISVMPYMDLIQHHQVTVIPIQVEEWKSRFYVARKKYGVRTETEESFFEFCKQGQLKGDDKSGTLYTLDL